MRFKITVHSSFLPETADFWATIERTGEFLPDSYLAAVFLRAIFTYLILTAGEATFCKMYVDTRVPLR